jgi:tetratricopeptide (TPR) repeat protein
MNSKSICLTFLFILLMLPQGTIAQVQSNLVKEGRQEYIEGIRAFTFDEYDVAERMLISAYKKLGPEPGISFALADLYLAKDDLPMAAYYGKEAVGADPQNKYFRLKLAEIYKTAGRNDATLEELTKLVELFPNDLESLFSLAATYRSYGEPIKSNQVLDRVLKKTGPNYNAHYQKFLNFQSMGLTDSAIVELKAIQEIDPDNLEVNKLLSELYQSTNQTGKAKLSLQEALRRNARDPESLIRLSGIYIDEAKWDSAGTLLGSIMEDPIVSPENKLRVAQYLYNRQLNEPQNIQLRIETERIIDLYTETETEYGPAFSLAGEYYARMGENDKAGERLKKAVELLPEDDIAWRQLLQILLVQEKLDEAIDFGLKADQNVPDDAFIQFFLGTAFLLQDNYPDAVEWMEKASRAPARKPFKSVVNGSLGDAYNALDDWEKARKAYELALRYDDENHNAKNNFAYALSVRGEDLERAKELALEAIEAEPENAAYLDTVGWVYFKLEDYDRARRFIRASIDIGNASGEVYEHLGDVYEKLGNMSEAKKWWKQALDTDPTRNHLQNKIDS